MSAAPVLSQIKKISLEVASGPLKGGVFNLAKPVIMIGRGMENDVVIEHDAKISRKHVEIRQSMGLVTINNVTEKNSVLLNGQLIKTAVIEAASRLLIGDTEFYVRLESAPGGGPGPRPMQVPALRSSPPQQYQNQYLHQPQANSKVAPNAAFQMPVARSGSKSKFFMYAIIGVVILVGGYFSSETVSKIRRNQQIKTTEDVDKEVKLATETVEEIQKKLEEKGVDSRSYQTAQQQYVRGFRDYRQGQYSRAIRELSAAITYYPQHELARRYLTMAQKKLDELVRTELDLGQKYRGQSSYRMCVASFKKVVMLLDDPEDPASKEAQKLMSECELQQVEHY